MAPRLPALHYTIGLLHYFLFWPLSQEHLPHPIIPIFFCSESSLRATVISLHKLLPPASACCCIALLYLS